MMEILVAWTIGLLTACGIYLTLRGSSFPVVVGLMLLSYAVNLFIFSMGRIKVDSEPVLVPGAAATLANTADPMPQALVLTAIVIGLATTVFAIVLALAASVPSVDDAVDVPASPREASPRR